MTTRFLTATQSSLPGDGEGLHLRRSVHSRPLQLAFSINARCSPSTPARRIPRLRREWGYFAPWESPPSPEPRSGAIV
jgi:hypothetical protein